MSSILRTIFFIIVLISVGFSTAHAQANMTSELAEIDREQDSILEMLATEEKKYQEQKTKEREQVESEKKLLSAKVELEMLKSEREKLLLAQAKKDKSNQIKVAKLQKKKDEKKKQKEKNIPIKVALKREEKVQDKKVEEKKKQEPLVKKVENFPKSNAITAHINLSSQQMKVFHGEKLLYKWRVSTARKGFVTPTGSYSPYYLQQMHYSKKYHNSPMPYSVFFRGGYAIHGTDAVGRLGSRASHGCVRLHTDNAKKLYTLIQKHGKHNTSIKINN